MINRHSTTARPTAAFTLVELLVVNSIIALLIEILLPALGKARDAGREAQSLSNVRMLAWANYNYAVDNDKFIGWGGPGMDRKVLLLPYTNAGENNQDADARQIWNSPANTIILGDRGINDRGDPLQSTHLISPSYPGSGLTWNVSGLCRLNPRHSNDTASMIGWADGHASLKVIVPEFYPGLPDTTLAIGVRPLWRPINGDAVITDVNDPNYLDTNWDLN